MFDIYCADHASDCKHPANVKAVLLRRKQQLGLQGAGVLPPFHLAQPHLETYT